MAYNPAQPRNPIGQWTEWGLTVGWHEYVDRRGNVRKYYKNNLSQMPSGYEMMHVGASGRNFSTLKNHEVHERVHITGTEDGEQLAIASTGNTCFGVINHDREAPEHTLSMCRGNKFQPVSENLPLDETSFGGRAAQLEGRKDGKVYDTLNARTNEQVNRAAFEGENAKVYHIDPKDFAEAEVKARHYYENELGLNNADARSAEVFVYMDKEGKTHVAPALKRDSKTGLLKRAPRPHNEGGSPMAIVPGDDLTRMTRAMQAEGLDDVQCAISAGTGKQANGHPQNALHFRKEFYRNKTSGDHVTSWGTIEMNNKGTEVEKARGEFSSDKEYADYKSKVADRRNKAASNYYHPVDSESAAKLMRRKTGNMNIPQDSIEMRHQDKEVSFAVRGEHTNTLYDGYGSRVGYEANDADGFRSMFNYSHQNNPVPAQAVHVGTGKHEGQYGITLRDKASSMSVVSWYNKRGHHTDTEPLLKANLPQRA